MIDLDQLKASVRLEDLLAKDGHTLRRSGPNLVCRCPFHEERSGSFTVFPTNRYKCFGCGAAGDPIDYVQASRGIGFAEAVEALGGQQLAPATTAPKPRPVKPRPTLALPELHTGDAREFKTLARLRGLDEVALYIASSVGWLRFGQWKDRPAWFILDPTRQNAQARRMDGKPWDEIEAKSWTLSGSVGSWPLGTIEAANYPFVVLCEGAPDFLAGLHLIWRARKAIEWCPVAILGASNSIPPQALAVLAGKRVRICPHTDSAGQRAAARWTAQLVSVGCRVDCFRFDGLTKANDEPVADLNDCTQMAPEAMGELEELLA